MGKDHGICKESQTGEGSHQSEIERNHRDCWVAMAHRTEAPLHERWQRADEYSRQCERTCGRGLGGLGEMGCLLRGGKRQEISGVER